MHRTKAILTLFWLFLAFQTLIDFSASTFFPSTVAPSIAFFPPVNPADEAKIPPNKRLKNVDQRAHERL
jgi:hypothetical protein